VTEEYKGYTVTLIYDPAPADPLASATPEERGAWFVLRHSRYNLPCELAVDFDAYDNWTALAAHVGGGKPFKFVQWYEHSGVVVSLRDAEAGPRDWDTGIAGVIVGETAMAIQRAFEPWSAYLAGEVYALLITAPDGNEVDHRSGCYGYGDAMTYARGLIELDRQILGTDRIRVYGRPRAPRAQELHA
jgi:hypothetical protein